MNTESITEVIEQIKQKQKYMNSLQIAIVDSLKGNNNYPIWKSK